jgi:hypothetical protein
MVMNSEPYFNDLGLNSQISTKDGQNRSVKYNQEIRLYTMKYAIRDQIKNPPKFFEEALKIHFRLKKQNILDTCRIWTSEITDAKIKADYIKTTEEIERELALLN